MVILIEAIYIKIEGHRFKYQVEDIIRAFFSGVEIKQCGNEPSVEHRSIFVLSRLGIENGAYFSHVEFKTGDTDFKNRTSIIQDGCNRLEFDKKIKRTIQGQLYEILKKVVGKELPWGILTGIRPSKKVHEMLETGKEREEILQKLNHSFGVSKEKAQLLYSVSKNQEQILKNSKQDSISLYIGIPFCTSRCLYCSFTSNPIGKYGHLTDKYMNALKIEILGVVKLIKENNLKIQSIYIGGGTPTSIDNGRLKELLEHIEHSFDFKYLEEYTLEAGRPDSIDREKLETIKASRVDRISINPQTMNDETLKLIGRNHTAEDIVKSFYLAKEVGFGNINMDVIAGLPGESLSMFENSMLQIKHLCPESLTIHTMSIKRASRLNEDIEKYGITPGDEVSDMVAMGEKYAESMGLHPYYLYRQKNILGNLENIGYCKPGFESIYNIQIMEEKQTIIAVGAGAVTKVVYPHENRIERAFNVKSVEEYVARVEEMVERKQALLK